MKSMEEYINEVYEKYEETERNHQKYKTVKVKYHSPLNKLCGVVVCVALIVTVFIGVKNFDTNTNEEIEYVVSSGDAENNSKVYTEYIFVDGVFEKRVIYLMNTSEYVIIVSNPEISDYLVEIKNNNKVNIKTIGKIQVERSLKGNIVDNVIQYSKSRWSNFY